MSQFQPGLYIILPKGNIDGPGFGTGPIPLVYPPQDVPIRVLNSPFIDRWIIKEDTDNTFNVYTGTGRSDDYKWILKNENSLFASAQEVAGEFRFESAGTGLWKIGLSGKDAILTYDKEADPDAELTFKPADGSDAQLFQAVRIDRLNGGSK